MTVDVSRRRRTDRARQVADVLRHQIVAGGFADGALPGEDDLGAEFAVSRNTVREALSLLRGEGLVDRTPGLGTTTCGEKYPHGLHRLMGLNETMHEHGTVTNEVRAAELIDPPTWVGRRLCTTDRVVYIERIRRLNGEPLSLDLTYLPRAVGEPLLAEDLANRDIFVLLETITGQRLGTADLTLEAVNADAHSASLLGTQDNAALLMLERLTHLADGTPVDLESIRLRGDRLAMRAQLERR
ncbi:putative GntR-family transcriptional regulator [Catellatospora sp. TT07R-123]|uniref:GntR family transcriptional regulator n=1 Tax=Catellatospora sp. TT07R-123 TaxID=2733863 RepID=UPI001B16CE73|nr:GntR family transcriptional regulator [Catellatospora sp. TT07R-123]GHJ42938.1 putative GntR-family transcriptional regulator [Catellatospora sp. TT07R-123]